MIKIVMIISLLLEGFISNHLDANSLLLPLFTVMSLIIIYPYFNNKDLDFLKYAIILGIFYDLIYINAFPLSLLTFLIIGIIIKIINFWISNNKFNVILISTIVIIMYRITTYIFLVVLDYTSFNLNLLLESIYSSLITNYIYVLIAFTITDKISKKYRIKKIN